MANTAKMSRFVAEKLGLKGPELRYQYKGQPQSPFNATTPEGFATLTQALLDSGQAVHFFLEFRSPARYSAVIGAYEESTIEPTDTPAKALLAAAYAALGGKE